MAGEWGERFRQIATGWLFDEAHLDPPPGSAILPLENPDLHDPEPFLRRLGPHVRHRTVALPVDPQRPAVLTPKFGGPAVAFVVDVLAAAGTRAIVGVGFCGALQPEIACGDLVLPTAAEAEVAVQARYSAPIVVESSGSLLRRLERAAASTPGAVRTGVVISTDAPLLEETATVQAWAKRGALGVDMESYALLSVARHRGIAAAAVLVSSDNATTGAPPSPSALRLGLERAIETAFGALA